MANVRKVIYEIRHPKGLCHPVLYLALFLPLALSLPLYTFSSSLYVHVYIEEKNVQVSRHRKQVFLHTKRTLILLSLFFSEFAHICNNVCIYNPKKQLYRLRDLSKIWNVQQKSICAYQSHNMRWSLSFPYTHIHFYIYTYTYTPLHIHIYISVEQCALIFILFIYTYTPLHIHTYTYTPLHIHIYISVTQYALIFIICIYTYTPLHIHIYTFTHTHTHLYIYTYTYQSHNICTDLYPLHIHIYAFFYTYTHTPLPIHIYISVTQYMHWPFSASKIKSLHILYMIRDALSHRSLSAN